MAVVVDEVREGAVGTDLSAVPLPELLTLLRSAAGELTSRMVRADFVESLAPVASDAQASALSGVTLPVVQEQVSALVRVVEGAATAVAGHT
ncbi:hypothetical protein M3D92_09685, partial [Micrococcus terreus]